MYPVLGARCLKGSARIQSNPRKWISGSSITPNRPITRSWISRIRHTTSDALADWQFTMGQVEVAGRTFEAALALHPDDLQLLGKLEQYWTRQGDAARAASYRERRMELTPRPSGG